MRAGFAQTDLFLTGEYELILGRPQRRGFHFRNPGFRSACKYAHKIPFVVKLNPRRTAFLSEQFDQALFGTVKEDEHGGQHCRSHYLFRVRNRAAVSW